MTANTSKMKGAKLLPKRASARATSRVGISVVPRTVGSRTAQHTTEPVALVGEANAIGVSLYRAADQEYVDKIRAGVPASYVIKLARDLRFSRESFLHTLHFPASTIERKIQKSERLSSEQSERLLGVARLIGQVQEMVAQSGNPEGFEASQWLGQWLNRPLPALGGEKPGDYMDTIAGQQVVSRLLAQIQSGAYA